jgi:hypothetical protein
MEEVMTGWSLLEEYDPKLISDLLAMLVPDTARYALPRNKSNMLILSFPSHSELLLLVKSSKDKQI